MGVISGQGLQAGTGTNTNPEGPTQSHISKKQPLEVDKLLLKGTIKIVTPCHNQFLGKIFVALRKDGSHRPVINLRPLNQFMMESLGMMKDLLRQDGFNRLKGYLPLSFGLGRPTKVPPLYVARHHILVPALRAVQCT